MRYLLVYGPLWIVSLSYICAADLDHVGRHRARQAIDVTAAAIENHEGKMRTFDHIGRHRIRKAFDATVVSFGIDHLKTKADASHASEASQEQIRFWQRFLEEDASLSMPDTGIEAFTVLNVLESEPDLSTLHSLMTGGSRIDEYLANPELGSTLFAPTNDAFANFEDQELLTRLLQPEWVLHRRGLLIAHIVDFESFGVLYAVNLTDGFMFENGFDFNLAVRIVEGDVFITSSKIIADVPVTEADLIAYNGVVHKVGELIVPIFFYQNIIEELAIDPFDQFMTMYDLIVRTGLDGFVSENLLTILWPLNTAFEELPDEVLTELTDPDNEDLMRLTLLYHMVPGLYPTDFLYDGLELVTAQGSNVTFYIQELDDESTAYLFNSVPAVLFNFMSGNAIAHALSGVLIPP